MSQQLILPINTCKLTASWKTDAYYKKFGFAHYGVDMVSTVGSTIICSSGDGEILAAGYDNVVGNIIVAKYYGALHRPSGRPQDVVFRYFHLAKISVKVGQKIDKMTALGDYGNTGILKMALHLHIEADIDMEHPLYSPTLRSSNLIKGTAVGASDKSMCNPLEFLHCKSGMPNNQIYATTNDNYIRIEDKTIITIQ